MIRFTFIAMTMAYTACGGCADGGAATTRGQAGTGAGGENDVVFHCEKGWCLVSATTFMMGSPEGEPGAAAAAENQVEVTLTRPFLLQQTELTLGQTRELGWPDPAFDQQGTCYSDDCPAGGLTFWESLALANELSRRHEPPL